MGKESEDDILTVEILEQSDSASRQSNQFNSIEKTEENSTPMTMKRPPVPPFIVNATAASADVSSDEDEEDERHEKQQVVGSKKHSVTLNNTKFHHGSKGAIPSPIGSAHSFDLQVSSWRMEKLEVDSKSGSDDEFYDCLGEFSSELFHSQFFNFRFSSLKTFSGCMWYNKFSCKIARYFHCKPAQTIYSQLDFTFRHERINNADQMEFTGAAR